MVNFTSKLHSVPGSPSDLNTGNGIEGTMVCTSLGSLLRPLFCFLCSNLKANPVTLFRSKVLPVNTYTRYSCTLSNFRLVHAFYRRDEPCTLHRLRLRPHLPLHHSAGALEPARGGADGGRLGGTGAQRRQRQRHRRLLSRPRIGAL